MRFLDMCEKLFFLVMKAIAVAMLAVVSFALVAMLTFLAAYAAGGCTMIQAAEPAWMVTLRVIGGTFGAMIGIGYLRLMNRVYF